MRNLIPILSLLSLFFGLQVYASIQIGSPQDLVKKAASGRIELREVIMDLQLNAAEFTTPQQFDPYFEILPDLEKLAQDLALDEIYPDGVRKLGVMMSSNGLRWLDISKDSADKIKYYHRWMDEDGAFRFQAQVEYVLVAEKDLNFLKATAVNIENLIPTLEVLFPQNHILLNAYHRLNSEAAVKIIKNGSLTEDEITFWLAKVSMLSVLADYFDILREETLSLTEQDKDRTYFIVRRCLVIWRQILANRQRSPSWIVSALGDVILEVLIKIQDLQVPLSSDQYLAVLKGMMAQHLKSLSQQMQTVEKLRPLDFSKRYLEWVQVLVDELRLRGLSREADTLVRYYNQISGPLMVKIFDIEGSYQLTDSRGQDWIFSVVAATDSLLVASLGMANGQIYKSYFNGYYNASEKKFVASLRESTTDPDGNPVIKFFINKNNQMEVEDSYLRGPTNILVGGKFETYPSYVRYQQVAGLIDGVYRGMVPFPKGTDMDAKLIVTSFNGYTLARLTDGESLDIEFNVGTRSGERPLYLTTGRLPSGTWIHMRLYQVSATEVRGYLIVGGRGKASQEFTLKKLN